MKSNLINSNNQYIGRNLLIQYENSSWGKAPTEKTNEGFRVYGNNTLIYSRFMNPLGLYRNLKAGNTYTISFDFKSNNTGTFTSNIGNAKSLDILGRIQIKYDTAEEWKHFSHTFIALTDSVYGDLSDATSYTCFYVWAYPSSLRPDNIALSTDWIELKNIKLEEGNRETDFILALEDTLEYIKPNLVSGTNSRWSNWINIKGRENSRNIVGYLSEEFEVDLDKAGNKTTLLIEIEFNDVIPTNIEDVTGTIDYGVGYFQLQSTIDGTYQGNKINTLPTDSPNRGINFIGNEGTVIKRFLLNADYNLPNDNGVHKYRIDYRCDYWASGQFRYRCLAVKEGKLPNPIWCKNEDEIEPNANLLEYYDNVPFKTRNAIYNQFSPYILGFECSSINLMSITDELKEDLPISTSYVLNLKPYDSLSLSRFESKRLDNGYYKLSFYAKKNTDIIDDVSPIIYLNTNGKTVYISIDSNKWKKYEIPIYLGSETTFFYLNTVHSNTYNILLTGIKLEKGSKSTKYIPKFYIADNNIYYYDDNIILEDNDSVIHGSGIFYRNSINDRVIEEDFKGITKSIIINENSYIKRADSLNYDMPNVFTISCYARGNAISFTINDTIESGPIVIQSYDYKRIKFSFTNPMNSTIIKINNAGTGSINICGLKVEKGVLDTDYTPNNVNYKKLEEGDYFINHLLVIKKDDAEYTSFNSIAFNIDKEGYIRVYASLPNTQNTYIQYYRVTSYNKRVSSIQASNLTYSSDDYSTALHDLVSTLVNRLHYYGYTDVKPSTDLIITTKLNEEEDVSVSAALNEPFNSLFKVVLPIAASYDDYVPESKFAGKFLDDSSESDWYYRDPNNGTRQSLVSITDVNTKLFDKDVGLDSHKGIFKDNTALEYIWIDFSQYGEEAFSGCTNLKQIVFTEGSVVRYAIGLFNGCTSLQTLDVVNCKNNNGATMLYFLAAENDNKIADCRNLTEIRFPENENGGYAEGNLDFSNNPLSRECAMRIVNSIIHKASYTLTFSKYTYDLLSEDDLATARSLWNIAYK